MIAVAGAMSAVAGMSFSIRYPSGGKLGDLLSHFRRKARGHEPTCRTNKLFTFFINYGNIPGLRILDPVSFSGISASSSLVTQIAHSLWVPLPR